MVSHGRHRCHPYGVALVCVELLRLPGRRRALVDVETAELGERMGEFRRLDPLPPRPAPGRQPGRSRRESTPAG
jgi:hypothetical protein